MYDPSTEAKIQMTGHGKAWIQTGRVLGLEFELDPL